jgi:uncharacterized protein YjbJ (UPF0337 family)
MQCWDYALPSIRQETNHEQHYRQDQGHGYEAAGAVKQSAGKAVGNPNLEVKGTLQKGKGEAQHAVGRQGLS